MEKQYTLESLLKSDKNFTNLQLLNEYQNNIYMQFEQGELVIYVNNINYKNLLKNTKK